MFKWIEEALKGRLGGDMLVIAGTLPPPTPKTTTPQRDSAKSDR